MSFLQAVYSLGQMAGEAYKDSPLADILNFLQLPYPLPEDEDEKNKVFAIRVWIDVTDKDAEVLDIKGVAKIDRIEYGAIGGYERSEIKIKERCLYRDPVGSNVSWRFTPLYKLGPGGKNSKKELAGENGVWQDNKDCRFYKLYHSVLNDYEKSGYFTVGSSDKIMSDMVEQIDRIAEFWSERNIPCFMIFGLKDAERFLYPGEINAFVNYFKDKLNQNSLNKSKKSKKSARITYCSLCGKTAQELKTLDKIFKFATFDKPNFLPGTAKTAEVEEKVFPVCDSCYETLSAGKEEMEKRFVNLNTIPKISLYVIPEIISDRQEFIRRAADQTRKFLKYGVRNERQLFRYLSRQDEGLVYHFLFAEVNQAQLIVHSLVEDVPPTHLQKLQELWTKTCQTYNFNDEISDEKCTLDTAISQIVAVFISLAGKSEQEEKVMKDKIIFVISGILSGEAVGIKEIKTLIVSRMSGLINDPDWLKPSGKHNMPGRIKIKGMAEVLDFLYRVNWR